MSFFITVVVNNRLTKLLKVLEWALESQHGGSTPRCTWASPEVAGRQNRPGLAAGGPGLRAWGPHQEAGAESV